MCWNVCEWEVIIVVFFLSYECAKIIRPHRHTTYVDAVYCYRPSSIGLSVTLVSPAKMAEPIESPFGLRTQVGPRTRVALLRTWQFNVECCRVFGRWQSTLRRRSSVLRCLWLDAEPADCCHGYSPSCRWVVCYDDNGTTSWWQYTYPSGRGPAYTGPIRRDLFIAGPLC